MLGSHRLVAADNRRLPWQVLDLREQAWQRNSERAAAAAGGLAGHHVRARGNG